MLTRSLRERAVIRFLLFFNLGSYYTVTSVLFALYTLPYILTGHVEIVTVLDELLYPLRVDRMVF